MPYSSKIFRLLLVVLLAPSLFFVATSYFQLERILAVINATPSAESARIVPQITGSDPKLAATVALEHDAMDHRHQLAKAFLSTRTWMRFMSLTFGALLVVIGCSFVLGRVSGPEFEGKGSVGELNLWLKSTSPGLYIIASGIILIAIPNFAPQQIDIRDGASYFNPPQTAPAPPILSDSLLETIKRNHGVSP